MNALVLPLTKITVVLATAWLLHAILARRNPRLRVLAWRMAAAATLIVLVLSLCPPWLHLRLPSPHLSSTTAMTNTPASATEGTHDAPRIAPQPAAAQTARSPAHPDPTSDATRSFAATSSSPAAPRAYRRPHAPREASPSPLAQAFTAWSIGIFAASVWASIGLARLRRIRANASPVPTFIEVEAANIALRLGLHRRFEIAQTRDIPSPCLIGLWRPLVLLPVCQCDSAHRDELGSILAHELAHLKGNDLAFNALLHALSIVLWFHPLAWFARRAHADACDEVCDALAAGYLGDANLYARTLARLVLRLSRRPRTVGLTMARGSHVQRRIAAVQRLWPIAKLPRWLVAVSFSAACAASLLCGGLSISESTAEPPAAADKAVEKPRAKATGGDDSANDREDAANPPKEPTASTIVQTTSAQTGEPLAGVGLRIHGRIGGQVFNHFATTDHNGAARLDWPPGQEVNNLWMTAAKSGFVSIHHVWRGEQKKIELPATIDLRFENGQRIGGTVKDEQGQPIAGASLRITMPVTWPKLANYMFTAASVTSDEDGKWAWDDAPTDTSGVSVRAEHPDHLPGFSTANRDVNNVAVLKQGLQVAGQVVDGKGKPIEGAVARLCLDRFGTDPPEAATDAEGRFVLKKCKPGRSVVTVQSEGFSPTLQELVVSDQTKDLRFALQPGHTLSVQVADINGKPLSDVWVVSDTWRSYRALLLSARTDAEGRVVFRSAPDDAVLFDVLQTGYMSARRTPLAASPETHKVTLYPELIVSGRVTDAETGRPIDEFGLRQGWRFANSNDVGWSRDEPTRYGSGQYEIKFSEPMEGYVLQVIAEGYSPATSRIFRSTEGKQTFDFEMKRGTGPTGFIALADGSPAAGAEVCLATQRNHAYLKHGHLDRRYNTDIVKTGADGRFTFPPRDDEPFLLIAVHDGGYVERLSKELKPDEPIVLEPWGRIEGLVLRGTKPDAGTEINFTPHRPDSRRTFPYVFTYDYTTKSDEHGRFTIERAMPGPGAVCRVVVTEFLQSWQHTSGWSAPVEIRPGKMIKVTVGGRGRPVVGSVQLKGNADVAIDWTSNQPATIDAWDNAKKQRAEPGNRFVSNLEASGRFNVPDVPAGDYKLIIPVNNPPSPNACGAGTPIGQAELAFSVPEIPGARSDQPLDLGEIEAVLFDTLDVGEPAPDFVVERLSGGSLQMSKLRGKLVLLDFWATWCAPCVAELPAFEKLHGEFGGNPRFALISLSCDNTPEIAKRFVDEKGLTWQQAFAGGTQGQVATAYTVRSLPCTFLIGPDGRVLAKNLRGAELRKAVAAALADDKLFDNAGAAFARFPITRFEPASELKPLAGKPGILVMDAAMLGNGN